jgi:hypothetical protein
MASRRPRKAELLEAALAGSTVTLPDLKRIASSLNLMEDRYMARPAAELMVERGDPGAPQIAAALAATPVLGRDPKGDRLRAAFKQAMTRDGIPPDVEAMARAFYERRGQPKGSPKSRPQEDWIATSDTGSIMGSIRRLFGRR